jgi:hypothetical protein
MNLVIRKAKSIIDFEYIRRIRNENRFFLTGNVCRIGLLRQLLFFLIRPSTIKIFVAELDSQRCGYLLLRQSENTTWITEVVEARFRGRGVARHMIRYAIGFCDHLSAEILLSNEDSLRLHLNAGFVRVKEENKRIHLVLSRRDKKNQYGDLTLDKEAM